MFARSLVLVSAVVSGVAAASPFQTTVVRDPAMETLGKAMAANVREQLAHRMEFKQDDFRVEIENLRIEPHVDLANVRSAQVLGLGSLGARRPEGLFSLPVLLISGGTSLEREVQATGVLKVTGPVYVAKGNLLRGHIIRKEDLLVTRLPWRGLPNGAFALNEKDLVGSRVKSLIPSGEPFLQAQLDEPLAVKTGEAIELTLVSGPGVIIRSRAIARQEGKVGDFIRIEQPDTKKVLSGTVTGEKTVEVRL